jgi:glycosyltransferase involved in cell wall biosynthesis
MRILQVIPVFSASFGGPVAVVRSMSKELAKRHEVTIYTTTAVDKRHDFLSSAFEVVSDGCHVNYFPRVSVFGGLNVSPTMARALKKSLSKYDIVHLHSWRHFQDLAVHHYARKCRVPYVLQTHGSLPRTMAWRRLKGIYDGLFGYRLLRDASKVIALNHTEAEQYRSMGVPEDKIEIIPNGIDVSEYANLPPKGCFKKRLSLGNNEKIILFLGRIHRIKGVDILIKAFASINKESENVKLVVAGPDDGYLYEVRALAKTLGIGDKIAFVGSLYGINKLEAYVDAEFLVVPSLYEIFGIVILEAYACGKPVIASRVMGPKELVLDGKTGILVNPGEINELTDAIKLLLYDESKTKNMGMNARQFVTDNFDIERVANKIETLYKETL